MSDDDTVPSALKESSASADGTMDEGRRYWKAAIAHLAPEKREAAWEFYLDRLESSTAADTLGGVMLLLEAHLAFFDDLPARLGAAARQLESAKGSAGNSFASSGVPPMHVDPANRSDRFSPSKRDLPPWTAAILWATLGAVLGGVGPLWYEQSRVNPTERIRSNAPDDLRTSVRTISAEPWYDPAARRQRGCIVCFDRAAWTERTVAGGAKVYVLSPVEDVRHDLESLRRLGPEGELNVP